MEGIKALLEKRADVTAKTKKGCTCFSPILGFMGSWAWSVHSDQLCTLGWVTVRVKGGLSTPLAWCLEAELLRSPILRSGEQGCNSSAHRREGIGGKRPVCRWARQPPKRVGAVQGNGAPPRV